MLAAAVVGRARRPITSYDARPGELLVHAVDLREATGEGGNFNAATSATPENLRRALAVLPELAEAGLVARGQATSQHGRAPAVRWPSAARVLRGRGARPRSGSRRCAPAMRTPAALADGLSELRLRAHGAPEHARTVCSHASRSKGSVRAWWGRSRRAMPFSLLGAANRTLLGPRSRKRRRVWSESHA